MLTLGRTGGDRAAVFSKSELLTTSHTYLEWALICTVVAALALVALFVFTGRRLYVAHHPLCDTCGKRVRSDARLCRYCRSLLITPRTTYLNGPPPEPL